MDIAQLLKESFDAYHVLPATFWAGIAEAGDIVTVDSEFVVKESGTSEKFLRFIVSGSGGILLWNKNNFVCTDLIMDGDFFCDYFSLLTREKTPCEVLTFEKTTLFQIPYPQLMKITGESSHGDTFWRYATTALYVDKYRHYIQAFTCTAAETYRLILTHHPTIVQRIPQKYIASFLGITPQSLSRIRRKLLT